MTVIEASIDIEEGEVPVLDVLSDRTDLSRTKIKQAMTRGAVWLSRGGKTKRLRRAQSVLRRGDNIAIYYSDAILQSEAPAPELVADEKAYSVWHKPAGLLSSGSRFGDHCAINRYVEQHWNRPVFLVHRLDRFAAGLIVLAHGKQAAAHLSKQFQARRVGKRYQAVVHGALGETLTLDAPLDGKPAITHVRPLDQNGEYTLVEVDIETGRKHQIRRHLANAGYPVAGDRQYGPDREGEMQLTAVALSFRSPADDREVSYLLPSAFHRSLRTASDSRSAPSP